MINGGDSDRGGQACCPLEDSEAIEIIRIRSVAGLTDGRTPLVPMPPCRPPPHTISDVALLGGGQVTMPSAASMAHQLRNGHHA
jgi:magnesium chelatase family protein